MPSDINSFIYRFDLIWHLVWRDFTLRYKRSVLGIFWSFAPSLAQLFVLVFLFRRIIPLNIEAYPAFLFSALLPWLWFTSSLNSAGGLFIYNRDLVRRPNFEPSTLVLVNTLSNLINFLLFLPILLILLLAYHRNISLAFFSLPLIVLIQGVLIAGLGLLVATVNVFYRDVQFLVNLAVLLLFYVTPIFYRAEAIAERFPLLYVSNPMAILIDNYRKIFFYGMNPDWGSLLIAGGVSAFLLGLGYRVYRRQLSKVFDAL